MKPQFNLRTLLTVTAFVALLVAWWVDRTQLQSRIDELETPYRFSLITELIETDGVQVGDSIPLESESEREN